MPRRIPIRAKLACALAVPLVGLVGGAAYEIVDADRTADAARSETDLAVTAVGPTSLVSQLQNERNLSSVDLIGQSGAVRLPVSSIQEARAETDAALARLRDFVDDRGEQVGAAFGNGLAVAADSLADVRGDVDGYTGPRDLTNNVLSDQVFLAYSNVIASLLDGTAGLALRIDDAELRTGVELVDLTTRLYELRSTTLRAAVAYVLAGNRSEDARLDVGGRLDLAESIEETIRQRAVAPYDGFVESALSDAYVLRQESMMRGFAVTGQLDVVELLDNVDSGPDRGVLLARRQASERLLAEAGAVLAGADEQRRTAVAFGGGLVVAALALTVLVSRSITRPLSSLTRQAEAMAGERLPAAVKSVLDTPLGEDVVIPDVDPIEVQTSDEVRDVAAALNVVQQSALDLAVEQAVLRRNIADSFVNMGRRNQNLLDRQLDFITDLEREEQDGDRLASLFRLDHLATRMRRNAESLLRLAGSEPQRQTSAPIDVGDVVRGALGEVEDYQRVQIRGLDAAAVPGGVGADLAHALAELLENALAFSPPTEPVEVRGRATGDGYVLTVADAGLGMTPEELEVANRRLAGDESFTVAPSRYLGHYVAGYLASRLGVRIDLQPGPAGGIVARVAIPGSVLADGPAQPRPVAPATPLDDLDRAEPAGSAPGRTWTAPDRTDGGGADPRGTARPPAAPPVARPVAPPVAPAVGPASPPVAARPPAPASPLPSAAGGPAPLPRRRPDPSTATPTAAPGLFTPPATPPVAPRPAAPRTVTPGFGGLAPVAPDGDGHARDGATTSSGLVRRVPGAQHPTTEIGAGRGTDRTEAERMSADAVSSFLSDFSAGVSRGIAETGHNPWEDGNEPGR